VRYIEHVAYTSAGYRQQLMPRKLGILVFC